MRKIRRAATKGGQARTHDERVLLLARDAEKGDAEEARRRRPLVLQLFVGLAREPPQDARALGHHVGKARVARHEAHLACEHSEDRYTATVRGAPVTVAGIIDSTMKRSLRPMRHFEALRTPDSMM